MAVSVEFDGTLVFVQFPVDRLIVGNITAKQKGSFDLGVVDDLRCKKPWANSQECIIDSPRDNRLVKRLKERICKKEAKAAETILYDTIKAENILLKEIVARFQTTENKLKRSLAYRKVKLASYLSSVCCDSQVRKKIKKLDRIKQIAKIRSRSKLSFRRIAGKLNISLNVATELWRQVRRSQGNNIVKLHTEILERITTNDFLVQFLKSIQCSASIKCLTSVQIFDKALLAAGGKYQFSFSRFFTVFKDLGYRFDSIRYAPKPSKKISEWHLQRFLQLYLFLLVHQRRFRTLFIDESSISPGNFKKKAWRHKSQSATLGSSIKYEKIMMIGAMTQKRVAGLQLLHSGFNSLVFLHFIKRVIESEVETLEKDQQLVLFMDNCPSHRSQLLFEFCRLNHVIVLFNLAHMSQFNPIEYLWEYLKRPLRKMTTYSK